VENAPDEVLPRESEGQLKCKGRALRNKSRRNSSGRFFSAAFLISELSESMQGLFSLCCNNNTTTSHLLLAHYQLAMAVLIIPQSCNKNPPARACIFLPFYIV